MEEGEHNEEQIHKEFLEGCMDLHSKSNQTRRQNDTLTLSKGENVAADDNHTYSLLEDFGDGDLELEDPFKYGTEEIMKDILNDDVVQRSISKHSAHQKRSSFMAEVQNCFNEGETNV